MFIYKADADRKLSQALHILAIAYRQAVEITRGENIPYEAALWAVMDIHREALVDNINWAYTVLDEEGAPVTIGR